MVRQAKVGERGPGRGELFRAPTVMTFLATTLLVWLLLGREEETARTQMLFLRHPSLKSFFTSHLLHTNGFHLSANVLAVLIAGGFLETRWGTPRFLVFYAIVAVLTTGVTLATGWIAWNWTSGLFVEPGTGAAAIEVVSLGASGVALACVVVAGRYLPERELFASISLRCVLWGFILLGGAGLALLDSLDAGTLDGRRLFLLPHISGVFFGLAYLELYPSCARKVSAWRRAREEREQERVGEIRHRVDQLLEKISTQGYESLSLDEKTFLREASKHFKRD